MIVLDTDIATLLSYGSTDNLNRMDAEPWPGITQWCSQSWQLSIWGKHVSISRNYLILSFCGPFHTCGGCRMRGNQEREAHWEGRQCCVERNGRRR